MSRGIRAGAFSIVRPLAMLVAAVTAVGVLSSNTCAQTLTDPNPQHKWSPPAVHPDAKTKPAAQVKTCGAYGAGFVNVPGTDTCVNAGGWVTVEGSTSR